MRLPRRLWAAFWSRSTTAYAPVATSPLSRRSSFPLPHDKRRWTRPRRLTLQRTAYAATAILTLLVLAVLSSGIPPSYSEIWAYENALPQHNLTEALAQNRTYLRIPHRVTGHGLNNVLQESVLLAYLAYTTHRALVFEDYIWSHSASPYVLYDFALRPARLPLNAFIAGPSAGGVVPPGSERAVNAAFWETVCPVGSRHVISTREQPKDADGEVLVEWWVRRLGAVGERCVEIESSAQPVFDHNLIGGPQVLSLWDGFSTSPVLTDFAWSPLVESALTSNLPTIHPAARTNDTPNDTAHIPTTFPGLVAVHIRRGDFARHCHRMVGWGANYMGFNRFPAFPDTFDSSLGAGEDRDTRTQYYLKHCFPTVEQIVEKLRAVREANPGLGRVYVLTNGRESWVRGLASALLDDGWGGVSGSLDLRLDGAQGGVGMAVDMAVAERAEVFVGNGFSSLSSNVMMLRMARGVEPGTNRLL